jgi:ATP-binding cassette subfamily B protein
MPFGNLLLTYLGPQSRLVAALAAVLIARVGLQVLSPLLLGVFIDAVVSGEALEWLTQLALVFLGASVAQQVLSIGAAFASERVAWQATNALRADLALHVLRLDPDFHAQHTPGDLVERVDGDVTAVASFFSQFVLQVLANILLLVGVLVVLWVRDWRIGAVLTAYAAVALVSMTHVRAVAIPHWTALRQASARLFGFIEERLAGLEDIRSNGATAHTLNGLFVHTNERTQTGRRARLFSAIPWSLPLVFSAIGTGLAFGLAAALVIAGSMTLGEAFTLYYYSGLVFMPLNRISSQLEEFQRASAGLVRIQHLRSVRSQLVDPPSPALLPSGALAVQLERVSFAYRADEPVLRDVSLHIEPGTTLGLVGRTGSGKTTIGRLILRLWDPQSGVVRIGGVDARAAHRTDLRHRIGAVLQEPQLFSASVRDNIALFDPHVTDRQLSAALDELGLIEWVAALPDGLDTLVGAGGRGLSAGETQLLALGRVFLRDPGLVLLDEPSSRLDPATERLIDQAIGRLLRNRSGLIISHRLATLDRADTLAVLEDGRVVEHGPRSTLLDDPTSRFTALLRAGGGAVPV